MKQTLQKEWKNALFLVLIVAAAVAIYLLSRGESPFTHAPTKTPAQSATTSAVMQEDTPEPTEQPGVAEGVFKTYLSLSDVITSEAQDVSSNTYIVSYREALQVRARLKYELDDGCISNVELAFPLPKEITQRSDRPFDALIYDANLALKRALPKGLPDVLCDVITAACSERTIYKKTIRAWAKSALALKGSEEKFEQLESGCRFLAYRAAEGNVEQLVCVFYLPQD